VHTFGMRFPIDVVFLDREDRVVRVAREVPPRRFAGARWARTVIETRAGEADRFLSARPRSRRSEAWTGRSSASRPGPTLVLQRARQVIEYETNPSHYQIEDPPSNRGHKFEEP